MNIRDIEFNIIFNSLGQKTAEAVLNGKYRGSADTGTSKSKFETDKTDAEKGIENFRKIKNEFLGNFTQKTFDDVIMKHINKIGINTATALSLAFFSSSKPKNKFPNILANVIGGGSHAKTRMNIQEIVVIPDAKTIPEAVEINSKIWRYVGGCVKGGLTFESAWAPDISSQEALKIARKAADEFSAKLGIDMAGSHLFKNNKYNFDGKSMDAEDFIEHIINIANEYELVYIEDPLCEDDINGFAIIRKKIKNALICGDDIIATDNKRLIEAVKKNAVNCVIVKPNQTGTISNCMELIKTAKRKKVVCVVSHRSGETDDTATAKLGQYAELVKFGAAGLRIVRLNELIRIWNNVKNPSISSLQQRL